MNGCNAGKVLRCLIVDDSASFLDAASSLLTREGLAVAGVASSTAEALQQIEVLRPDVALVDVSLGSESGLDLARKLAETGYDGAVILISTRGEADLMDLIAETPSAGFVPKAELSAAAILRLVDGT